MRRKPLMLAALAGVVAAALLMVPAAEAQELAPAAGVFSLPKGAKPVGNCPGLAGKPVTAAQRGKTVSCFVRTPAGVSTAPAGAWSKADSGIGTTAAPDWCTSVNSYWITFRFDSCRQEHGEFVLYVLDPITSFPRWLGSIKAIFVLHQKLSNSSPQWEYHVEIRTGGATIGARQGVFIYGWFGCWNSATCLTLISNFTDQILPPNSTKTATGTFDTGGLGGLGDWRTAHTYMEFRVQPVLGGIEDGAYFRSGDRVRCDNALPGYVPGCVHDVNTPNFMVESARYPAVARHVRLAQESGLPFALRRLIDPSMQAKNGRRACGRDKTPPEDPGLPFPPPGTSCDEYPMRSTYEGAEFAFQAGGKPRTFDNCGIRLPRITGPGWSACMVPAGQNSGAGAKLGNFYAAWRVIDSEWFTIGVL